MGKKYSFNCNKHKTYFLQKVCLAATLLWILHSILSVIFFQGNLSTLVADTVRFIIAAAIVFILIRRISAKSLNQDYCLIQDGALSYYNQYRSSHAFKYVCSSITKVTVLPIITIIKGSTKIYEQHSDGSTSSKNKTSMIIPNIFGERNDLVTDLKSLVVATK